MSDFLQVCEQAARAGGQVLLEMRDRFRPREKAVNDFVTDADERSQAVIRQLLLSAYPHHDFLGEEADPAAPACGPESHQAAEGYRWIVDPLDGTANYLHRLQTFAVSIALEHRGEIVCGVVYDPVANECYAAERGQGAWLNGKRIFVSGCASLAQAMVAVSFPPQVRRDSVEIARFVEALLACQSVRRLGSAALNLAYLAAGRLDSYFATSVKCWDIAAGVLLVREAGGAVTDLRGGPLDLWQPEFLASATPGLHKQLVQLLAKAEGR